MDVLSLFAFISFQAASYIIDHFVIYLLWWWLWAFLYNHEFVLRCPAELWERPGGHTDQAGLAHPPQTEQQLLNQTSTFSCVSPRWSCVPESRSVPVLSSRALLFISLCAQFGFYYTDVFGRSISVHMAAICAHITMIPFLWILYIYIRIYRFEQFNSVHTLVCAGFDTHNTVNVLL